MGRYVAAFALLGFLGTILMAFFNDAALTAVMSQAVFWALCCGVVGGLLSIAVHYLVREIELPDAQRELELEEQEAQLRQVRLRNGATTPGPGRTTISEKSGEEAQAGADKADRGGDAQPREAQAV